MSVLLPAGFTLEPATGALVAEVFELVAAEQSAAFGFCPDTEEDVRSMLEPPAGAASIEHLVRDSDGVVAQWWVAFRDPGDPITYAWISTHPHLPEADSDELARAGWAMMLDWIRAHPPGGADDDIQVHSGCPAGSAPNPRHLAEAGFARQRTFWEMLGPVTDDTRTAVEVPGLVIEASRDEAVLHGVLNEAFVGHYGFTPVSLEDWLAVEQAMAGFDPNLRYLATIDGEPAAAMLLSRRVETEGAMYVGELSHPRAVSSTRDRVGFARARVRGRGPRRSGAVGAACRQRERPRCAVGLPACGFEGANRVLGLRADAVELAHGHMKVVLVTPQEVSTFRRARRSRRHGHWCRPSGLSRRSRRRTRQWRRALSPHPGRRLGIRTFYSSTSERDEALPAWLHFYNHHRAHSAIGGQPPVTRLTNLSGHHG